MANRVEVAGVRRRWLPVGILALAIFVVNAAARFVSWKAGVNDETGQTRLGFLGVTVVALVLFGAAIRWSLRYPSGRLVADIGAATIVGTLLAVIVGPFFGGDKPFA